jgi:CheY-like chemotaxis protein
MTKSIDLACIIDDDPIYIFGLKKMMKLVDLCESFMIFHNGKEAINALKPLLISGENLPDVILLDINMPIMDGWQFLDSFIKIPTQKKIIIYMVTSSIDPRDIDRVKKYEEITNYVVKPVSIEKLKQLKEELVRKIGRSNKS